MRFKFICVILLFCVNECLPSWAYSYLANSIYNPITYFFSQIYVFPILLLCKDQFKTNSKKNAAIISVLSIGAISAKAVLIFPIIVTFAVYFATSSWRQRKANASGLILLTSAALTYFIWHILVYKHDADKIAALLFVIPKSAQSIAIVLHLTNPIILKIFAIFWRYTIVLFPILIGSYWIPILLIMININSKYIKEAGLIPIILFLSFSAILISFSWGTAVSYWREYSMLFSIPFIMQIFNNLDKRKSKISLIIILLWTILSIYYDIRALINNNQNSYSLRQYFTSQNKKQNSNGYLSSNEYDGLQYLRNNLNSQDIVLSDRTEIFDYEANEIENRFFFYSAFSGKQMYLEGSDYNFINKKAGIAERKKIVKTIYSSRNQDTISNICSRNRISYIIWSKRIKNKPALSEVLNPVFENNDIAIYKVK